MKHICQSDEWAQFKKAYGNKAVKAGGVWFFLSPIPFTKKFAGYCPKGDLENINWQELYKAAKEENCVFVKVDPCNIYPLKPKTKLSLKKSKAIFSQETIILDISQSEEKILEKMEQKTRYNTRLAQKSGLQVVEASTKEDLQLFINIQQNTAKRQGFFVHPARYFEILWDSFYKEGIFKILIAKLEDTPVAAWGLFIYGDTIYYPYGGSYSNQYSKYKPSNLLVWETIKLGKAAGCNKFDMWGVTTNQQSSWWGFSKFKLGFGGEVVKFADTVDLVIGPLWYKIFLVVDRLRWFMLRLLHKKNGS